jgi:hypothetical protein|tara:strand:- start:231 stop:491 length:261 start_codon:yes stop_codon:yes gene_type:complete
LPFQEFRDINGKLSYLSGDTYDESLDGEKGSFYRGRVDIAPSEFSKLPNDFRLIPRMTASADMKVEKKSYHLPDRSYYERIFFGIQ